MKKIMTAGISLALFIGLGIYLLFNTPEIGEKSDYYAVNVLPSASLKLVEVSPKNKQITVEYAYNGHSAIVHGTYHRFEVWKEDGWYTLIPKNKNLVYSDIAYYVKSGKTAQETYGWADYGSLPKGRYRFVQEVTEELDKVDAMRDYALAVEFEIK